MKKILLVVLFALICFAAMAQDAVNTTSATECYKLFPTQNMWTFLKLDTRNGRIWQVQFTVKDDPDYRYQTVLSDIKLVSSSEEVNNRFTLYSTQNMYNFILLDQIDGRCWQVQWKSSTTSPLVIPIY